VSLLKAPAGGKKGEITEAGYRHYLEVLPPVTSNFTRNGERWGFGFAEGLDMVVAFTCEGGRYYAQKTDILNPQECGVSVADHALGKADRTKKVLAESDELPREQGLIR
jgi:hypothetical protein